MKNCKYDVFDVNTAGRFILLFGWIPLVLLAAGVISGDTSYIILGGGPIAQLLIVSAYAVASLGAVNK